MSLAAFALPLLVTLVPVQAPIFAGARALDPALDKDADRAAVFLGAATIKVGGEDAVDADDSASVGVDVELLRRQLAAARDRMLEGDFKRALARADEGIAAFDQDGDGLPGDAWTLWADLVLVRAEALRRLDREAECDEALAQLVAVMPDFAPDVSMTPPPLMSRYAAARASLAAKRPGSVTVTSSEGAAIYVDGRAIGPAPQSLGGLLPGRHVVAVSQGAVKKSLRVTVDEGGAETVDLPVRSLQTTSRALRDALVVGASADALGALGGAVAPLTYFAVLAPQPGDAALVLFVVEDGRLTRAVGARLDVKTELKAKAGELVEAAQAGTDGWITGGVGHPKDLLLGGDNAVAAVPNADEPVDVGLIAGVAGGVAAALLVGTAVVVAIALAPQNPGGIDVFVDASEL